MLINSIALYLVPESYYKMKHGYFFLLALLITGCTRVKYVEFNGTMPGINSGAFVIKDANRNLVYSESIFGGKLNAKKILQQPGYYDMYITADINKDYKKHVYDVYLDEGVYTITTQAGKLDVYPAIQSSSAIQNQLSDYYAFASEKMHHAAARADKLGDSVYGKNAPPLHSSAYNALFAQYTSAVTDMDNAQSAAFETYVNQHSESQVEAHILSEINYKKDAATYYRIFQKFNNEQKNSSDGKDEGDELNLLAKLSPGAPAPPLLGKTADGMTFDPKNTGKKVILIEFWRADNEVSRENHQRLLNEYDSILKNKNVGVISVSLDTKQAVWAGAIKQDKLTWPQISDLKGESSPNMANWGVSTIPTYDLVNSDWHFIKRDVEFNQLGIEVYEYLKKAH